MKFTLGTAPKAAAGTAFALAALCGAGGADNVLLAASQRAHLSLPQISLLPAPKAEPSSIGSILNFGIVPGVGLPLARPQYPTTRHIINTPPNVGRSHLDMLIITPLNEKFAIRQVEIPPGPFNPDPRLRIVPSPTKKKTP